MMVYVFKNDGTTHDFVGNKNVYGAWLNDGTRWYCRPPMVNMEGLQVGQPGAFNLTTGANYKFALSARSGSTVQSIKLYSGKQSRPAG